MRYELRRRGVFDRELGRVITPKDPEWALYQAALNRHETPDPMPAESPAPEPFNFEEAGRAREERQLRRIARTDPLRAALKKGGIIK